ncbi:MAG: carboxypeptidase regulatory-like domain-containing protein [Planctomycetota bacterium]
MKIQRARIRLSAIIFLLALAVVSAVWFGLRDAGGPAGSGDSEAGAEVESVAGGVTPQADSSGVLGSDAVSSDGPGREEIEGGATEVGSAARPAGSVSGRVVDSAGRPLAGVTVKEEWWGSLPHADPVKSGPDGSFRLEGLRRTLVTILAEMEGLAMRWTPGRTIVKPGEEVSGVEIVMFPDRPIRGRIASAVGLPVSGASVRCGEERFGHAWPVTDAVSDAVGRFKLGPIPDVGTYEIKVSASGYRPVERSRVEPGASLEIELTATGRIEVVPVSEDTGKPVRPARLVVMAVSGDEHVEDGSGMRLVGRFEAEQEGIEVGPDRYAVPTDGSGRFRVRVEADGFLPGWTDVVKMEGAEDVGPFTVLMDRGGGIRGVVVLAETGEPIAGAVVQLAVRGAESVTNGRTWSGTNRQRFFQKAQRRTNGQGQFAFDVLPVDRYAIRAQAEGYPAVLVEDLEARRGDESEPIRIEIPEGGALFGTVIGLDGKPQANAKVVARQASGFGVSVATDGEGDYRISPLAPGFYRVELAETPRWRWTWFYLDRVSGGSSSSSSDEYPVEVRSGQEVRIDLDQRAGKGAVAGTILFNGRPQKDLEVRALPAGEPGREKRIDASTWDRLPVLARSDASGFFRIEGIPAGTWDLLVTGRMRTPLATRRIEVRAGAEETVDLSVAACRLRGEVVDAGTGMPVPGATVRATRIQDAEDQRNSWKGFTSRTGEFASGLLPVGDYTIEARTESSISSQERVSLGEGEERSLRLTLEPAGSLRVAIQPAGWIRRDLTLRLTDESTGEEHPILHERTEPDGSLLLLSIRPGTYRLLVRHDSLGRSASATVKVERKRETFATMTLEHEDV